MKLTLQIIFRTITLPLMIALFTVGFIKVLFIKCIDWIAHGGELIVFDKILNTQTVKESIHKLLEHGK